jgi:hypothetical protein
MLEGMDLTGVLDTIILITILAFAAGFGLGLLTGKKK